MGNKDNFYTLYQNYIAGFVSNLTLTMEEGLGDILGGDFYNASMTIPEITFRLYNEKGVELDADVLQESATNATALAPLFGCNVTVDEKTPSPVPAPTPEPTESGDTKKEDYSLVMYLGGAIIVLCMLMAFFYFLIKDNSDEHKPLQEENENEDEKSKDDKQKKPNYGTNV